MALAAALGSATQNVCGLPARSEAGRRAARAAEAALGQLVGRAEPVREVAVGVVEQNRADPLAREVDARALGLRSGSRWTRTGTFATP